MPGLVLFRRRWSVGSDDFVYPSLLEMFLRLSWLIAISIVYGINYDKFTCDSTNDLQNYFFGIFVFNIISTIISIIVMLNSMKGAISDTFKRKHVPYLLYLKLIILFPECIWVVLGTYWAFRFEYNCPYGVVWTVKGTVIFSYVVGLIVCILIFLVFDPLGKYIQHNRLAKKTPEGCSEYKSVAAIKAWERRCGLMCCCIANNQQNRDAFTEISKLMADFFLDVDLVPTDIAAGLILIQKIQMKAENQLQRIEFDTPSTSNQTDGKTTPTPSSTASTMPTPKPWMTIKLMAHYMNFSSASYGWPLFMYTNLGTGLCRLLNKSRCCSCIRQEYNIVQDNNCNCHTAAILIQTGLKKEDLIYVSYHNKLAEIPFYVALDRKEMKVVVSIRGTMSLEDALTDLSAVGINIAVQGVDNCYVHCGIFKCAKYIQDQLLELQLIEKAFNAFPDADGLVITGHSLGAGAAAILAMLLRESYPELRCYAFSPPGGLLSPTASKHAQDYICSVIVGKDVIPRLAIPSLSKLKSQILKVLTDCKKPKYRIYAGGCVRFCCECLTHRDRDEVSIDKDTAVPVEEPVSDTAEDSLRTAYVNANRMIDSVEWPMNPPGQILHVYEVGEESKCWGSDTIYSAAWLDVDDFNEILISPSMAFDHFAEVVSDSLEQLEKRNFEPTTKHATTLQATILQTSTTQATTPEARTPEATILQTTTTQASTPGATPQATTPEARTPEATTPEATTASEQATTPEATTLQSTTPEAETNNTSYA